MIVVRCPKCGSMDASSVEPVGIEFDRMRCGACGHEQICDLEQIKSEWNQHVADGARLDPWCVLPDVRFIALWEELVGTSRGAAAALAELARAHDEPHRHHHTASYVGDCLRVLDRPEVRALAERPAEVELALWFHDVVHEPLAADNEARSAAHAEATLRAAGLSPGMISRVCAGILATGGGPIAPGDAGLVADIDLAFLGEGEAVVMAWERDVAAEHAGLDAGLHARRRASRLRGLLERPSIYSTGYFRERYERAARDAVSTALLAYASAV